MSRRSKRILVFMSSLLVLGVLCGTFAFAESTDAKVHQGDLTILEPENATIDQTVEGDLLGAAMEMSVSGHVTGSIRVAAMTLILSGRTDRNVTVAAMELKVEETAVAQDVVLAVGTAYIYGTFENLTVYGQNVVIAGTVTGKLVCEADQIIILEGASFTDARFISQNEPVVAKTLSSDSATPLSKSEFAANSVFEESTSDWMMALLSLVYTVPAAILLALLLAWVLNKKTADLSLRLRERKASFVLRGFGLLFGLPLAALFLMASAYTMAIGGVLLLVVLLVAIVAEAVTACLLGRIFLPSKSPYLTAAIFAAGLCVLSALPYVGSVVTFAEMAIAFGCLGSLLFTRKKNQPQGDGVDFRL